jgi:hypothetical protein
MIPVPSNKIKIMDFSKENYHKERFLNEEINYIPKNEKKVKRRAKYICNSVTKERSTFFILKCCNFKLLEKQCKKYESMYTE